VRRWEGEKIRREKSESATLTADKKMRRTPVKSAVLVFFEEFNWASRRVRGQRSEIRDYGLRNKE
jgi:hypothetical protein